MVNFIITAANRTHAKSQIDQLDPTIQWLMTVKESTKSRTLLQNNLSHAWYEQLASELKDMTANEYKCFCKLNFGVPILRAEDAQFRAFYDDAIKSNFTYEQKLKAMQYLPVTSLMKTKQLTQYLDAIRDKYAGQVDLQYPNEYFEDYRELA